VSNAEFPIRTTSVLQGDAPWRTQVLDASRVLATVTLIGIGCGVLVVGVLGRLAMSLLAVLNPDAHGLTSDDGFTIGQFTVVGSIQLAAAGVQFGVLGAWFYLALRGLAVGPSWFRTLSLSLGPAVVIAAIVVDPDGVDFTHLHPTWLAIGLFIALPATYVALLHVLSERVLRSGRGLPVALWALGLLPWIPLFPLALVLLAGFLAIRWVHGHEGLRRILTSQWVLWLPRLALAGLFVVSAVKLVRDYSTLTSDALIS
jgi:hypothetical protein